MKVKDLIERLQAVDPELMVVRGGYEGGVTEATEVDVAVVALNVNTEWYYGEHEIVEGDAEHPDKERASVLYIH